MGAVTQLHAPATKSSSDQVHHPNIANEDDDDDDDEEEDPDNASDDDEEEEDCDKGFARKEGTGLLDVKIEGHPRTSQILTPPKTPPNPNPQTPANFVSPYEIHGNQELQDPQ